LPEAVVRRSHQNGARKRDARARSQAALRRKTVWIT
jgi:hypothetical protein